MILISDGEDHEGKAVETAKAAAEEGVVIYTAGVGSESGALQLSRVQAMSLAKDVRKSCDDKVDPVILRRSR